jgi:hypothetical protein
VLFKFRIVIIWLTPCAHTHLFYIRSHLKFFQLVPELGTLCLDSILECYFFLLLSDKMSQNLNTVPAFDGTNYDYW